VLVATAFIANPLNKPFVHHIDGDTLNNDFNNLMWVTKNEHDILTKELDQYIGKHGIENSSATSTDEQISLAIKLLEENELYLDEISDATGLSISVINKLRQRKNSWDYLKIGHDKMYDYNKFRRTTFPKEKIDEFIYYKHNYPGYKLIDIAKAIELPYTTVKQWNRKYN
jgi:transposase